MSVHELENAWNKEDVTLTAPQVKTLMCFCPPARHLAQGLCNRLGCVTLSLMERRMRNARENTVMLPNMMFFPAFHLVHYNNNNTNNNTK